MIQASANNSIFTVEFEKEGNSGKINGSDFHWDLLPVSATSFHIIRNAKSFRVIIENRIPETKTLVLRINGKKIEVGIKDKMDLLLASMGLENTLVAKVNEVKAPMPGLVLRIQVSEGDHVNKGDTICVLEAMKMENSIKSPGSGEVAKIHVDKGQAVEKNQILISFR
jgi:biotin carboxyl carrier protein